MNVLLVQFFLQDPSYESSGDFVDPNYIDQEDYEDYDAYEASGDYPFSELPGLGNPDLKNH